MTTLEMDTLLTTPYLQSRSDITAAQRLLFLNEAQKGLAISFFFDELETLNDTVVTTSGDATYVLPTNDYYIQTVRNVTDATYNYPLIEKDWQWYNHRGDMIPAVGTSVTGVPEYWLMHEGLIYLDPTPNGAYTLRTAGVRLPAAMVSGGQAPTLPEDWHHIIVMLAAADILFAVGDTMQAMTLKSEALAKINSRQEKRTLRRLDQTGQIHVARYKAH